MQSHASPTYSRSTSFGDRLLTALDSGLRTSFAPTHAGRASPAAGLNSAELNAAEAREAGALMRVNHVGEICAQALYQSQALFSRSAELRHHFEQQLSTLQHDVLRMGTYVVEMLDQAMQALEQQDIRLAGRVVEMGTQVTV